MELSRQALIVARYSRVAMLLRKIIGVWNRVSDFKTAYLHSLLFLELMNWYDGVVIVRLGVGHSRFWLPPGCEVIPYVQTWAQVMKKRTLLTLIWIVGAALMAGIGVTLQGKDAIR